MRASFKLMMILLGGVVVLPAVPALIVTEAQAKDSVGAKVGVPLKAALELAQQKDFKGALAKAREADAMPGKSAFETYSVNQLLSYIYANTGDYNGVARSLEGELESGKVPAAERATKIKSIAQAYYRAGNYPKGIAFANRYNKEFGSDADMQLLIAQGYYVNKDYAGAKNAAMSMIRASTAAGRRPDENSLKLLLGSAYSSGDKAASRQAMLWLVEYYPSPAYWSDLLDLMQTQAGSDARANLEVFRLKNATNAIKQPDDFIEAAQIAIQVGFPGEAQSIMEKGYSSKVLGKSAKSEREQRLLNMAKSQASADKASLPASAGGSGEAMAATGEAYLTYGQTSKAVTALNGALAKGGLKNKDEVQLHLGQAYLASGNAGEARRAFAKVGGKYADLAKLWVLHSQR